jgi:hypothetical protein
MNVDRAVLLFAPFVSIIQPSVLPVAVRPCSFLPPGFIPSIARGLTMAKWLRGCNHLEMQAARSMTEAPVATLARLERPPAGEKKSG